MPATNQARADYFDPRKAAESNSMCAQTNASTDNSNAEWPHIHFRQSPSQSGVTVDISMNGIAGDMRE